MPQRSAHGGTPANETLLVSNAILWCLVIALAVVVVALARQVGILHERVAPAGALMPTNGPKVGERTAAQVYTDTQGAPVTIGGASAEGSATLVLWVSPTCPVCLESLCESMGSGIASLQDYARLHREVSNDPRAKGVARKNAA